MDPKTVKKVARPEPAAQGETLPTAQPAKRRIELAEIVGLPDFTVRTLHNQHLSSWHLRDDGAGPDRIPSSCATQEAAKQVLPSKAFAYYSSGGTDEYTLGLNR